MRKHLIWVLGVVVAVGSVVAAGLAIASPNTQSIVATTAPKKVPKTERKPISLDVNVFATHPAEPGNPNGIPHPTKNAVVDFDANLKFQQKGYPTCDPDQFGSSTTTQDVRDECGDAAIGDGSATVVVPGAPGAPPVTVKADVVAANVKGNKVLLHSHNPLSGGQPLVGQLKKTGGNYGTKLTVPVPPLAGGAAVITQFQTKIDKVAYRHQGKKLAIISGNCKDKTQDFRASFTDDQGNVNVGTDVFKCKRKG
jgi:hypothetical protein